MYSTLRNFFYIFGIIVVLSLFSCNVFAPSERQDAAGSVPQAYSLYTTDAEYEQLWWRTLNDPELNRLVEDALTDNFSIQQAWAKLEQARALAIQAGADLWPDLTGTGDRAVARNQYALLGVLFVKAVRFCYDWCIVYQRGLHVRVYIQVDKSPSFGDGLGAGGFGGLYCCDAQYCASTGGSDVCADRGSDGDAGARDPNDSTHTDCCAYVDAYTRADGWPYVDADDASSRTHLRASVCGRSGRDGPRGRSGGLYGHWIVRSRASDHASLPGYDELRRACA